MPCCDAFVVMKTSARGLNFFSHKSRGPCQSAPETEAHLALKTLAARAAREHTGRKTGFWLEELAAPYYVFEDAGAPLSPKSPINGTR